MIRLLKEYQPEAQEEIKKMVEDSERYINSIQAQLDYLKDKLNKGYVNNLFTFHDRAKQACCFMTMMLSDVVILSEECKQAEK